jgi:hypothetical protein
VATAQALEFEKQKYADQKANEEWRRRDYERRHAEWEAGRRAILSHYGIDISDAWKAPGGAPYGGAGGADIPAMGGDAVAGAGGWRTPTQLPGPSGESGYAAMSDMSGMGDTGNMGDVGDASAVDNGVANWEDWQKYLQQQ